MATRRSAEANTLRAEAEAYVAPIRAPIRTISVFRAAIDPRRMAEVGLPLA